MILKIKPLLVVIGLQLVFLSSVLAQSCVECTTPSPINNGIVFCAPMNGNANDVTPSPASPSVVGATLTTDRFGNANSAYDFSNPNSHRINYSAVSKLSIGTSQSFTISTWVYARSLYSAGNEFTVLTGSDLSAFSLQIGGSAHGSLNGKLIYSDFYRPTSTTSITLSSPSTIPLNTWHFVVLTIDKTTGLNSLYLNGSKVASGVSTSNPAILNGFVSVGNHNVNAWGINGKVDDVRVFTRALDSNEVSKLYSSSLPVLTPISDKTICLGDSVQLISSGGTTYSWTPSTGLSNPNIANPYAKPTSSMQYIVTITNGDWCTVTDTVNVTVNNNCCPSCTDSLPINNGLIFCAPMTGNANDLTASPVTPSVYYTTTLTADRVGNSNSAYDFANIASDRIKYSSSSKLSIPTTQSFSLSAWFYARSTHTLSSSIITLTGGNLNAYSIFIGGTTHGSMNGKIAHIDFINSPKTSSTPINGPTITLNSWHHVVVTIDRASGAHTLYLDGNLESSSSSFLNPVIATGFVTVGNHDVNAWGLDGKVDDVRIYNRTLSSSEISFLYSCNYVNGFSKMATAVTPITNIEKVSIYPNPSNNGIFEFSLGEKYTNNELEITIHNQLGQLVESNKYAVSNNRIDISTLSRGLYFVEFKNPKTGETTIAKIAYW